MITFAAYLESLKQDCIDVANWIMEAVGVVITYGFIGLLLWSAITPNNGATDGNESYAPAAARGY